VYRKNHGFLDDLTIASSCLFQYCPLLVMLVANISLMALLSRYSNTHSIVYLGTSVFKSAEFSNFTGKSPLVTNKGHMLEQQKQK
jgi:hypothetical protein